MNDNGQQLNVNVDIKTLDNVECDECKNIYWDHATIIKRVSALYTETGKPGYLPIQTWSCTKCGHVNAELDPTSIVNQIK